MMAKVVNLRSFRKRMAREDKEISARVNRAAFGRTKSEKELSKAKLALEKKALDKHKRDE